MIRARFLIISLLAFQLVIGCSFDKLGLINSKSENESNIPQIDGSESTDEDINYNESESEVSVSAELEAEVTDEAELSVIFNESQDNEIYSEDPTEGGESEEAVADVTESEEVSEGKDGYLGESEEETSRAPLFVTSMTHLEGNWTDDIDKAVFIKHVKEIRYGIELAQDYDFILTFETEKPFARANIIWGMNVMDEILESGYGVGTHCDVGAKTEYPLPEFVEYLKENKKLVDDLVGKANNHGCSGAGGPNNWVSGLQLAGFEYVDGIVGYHLLAFDEEDRPDPGWDDAYILNEGYHYSVPEDIENRIYLMKLENIDDWNPDESGIFVSNGAVGSLASLAEESGYSTSGKLEKDDVDTLKEIILNVDSIRDTNRVAKLDVYLPLNIFEKSNEDVLTYFFKEMQILKDNGTIEFATQWDVVKNYLKFTN